MMKILTLIAFLLFGFATYGQVQFSLSSQPVQYQYIDEWQKHKTIEAQCVNSGYEDVLVWFRSILYFNDTILYAYNHDSLGQTFKDTLAPGTHVLYLNSLLSVSNTYLLDSFAESYSENQRLRPGSFKLICHLIIEDSLVQSDSVFFDVKSVEAPALVSPFNECNIYRNHLLNVKFEWNPVEPLPVNSVIYEFKLFEFPIDTGEWEVLAMIELDEYSDLPDTALIALNPKWYDSSISSVHDIEWAAQNVEPIWQIQLTDITELYLPSYIAELLFYNYTSGKTRYGWTIKALDTDTLSAVGSNMGNAFPFVFTVTDNSNHTNYTLSKNGEYCPSNGFESGEAPGWVFFAGTPRNILGGRTYNWRADNVNPIQNIVISHANDPKIPILSTTTEPSNQYTLRVGDLEAYQKAAMATHTFTVDANHVNMRLWYSTVLNNAGGHRRTEQPLMQIKMHRNGFSSFPFFNEKIIAGYKGVTKIYNGYVYGEWQCFDIDLTKHVGQTVTIVVQSSDCTQGAHEGYTYIDFCAVYQPLSIITTSKDVYCMEELIIADGSQSTKGTKYEWTVEETDAFGNLTGLRFSQQYAGEPESDFNAGTFYIIKGGQISCGSFYKITLAVWSDCGAWSYNSKIIEIKCIEENIAGEDFCCLNKNCLLTIGMQGAPGNYVYSWLPINNSCSGCISPSNVANPEYDPTLSISPYQDDYILSVFDPASGCATIDRMSVYFSSPTINPIVSSTDDCGTKLTAFGNGVQFFEWEVSVEGGMYQPFGDGNFKIVHKISANPHAFDRYRVRAINECGTSAWQTFDIYPNTGFYGNISEIIYPTGAGSNHSGLQPFVIYDYNEDPETPDSYNITEWELWVLFSDGMYYKVNSGKKTDGKTWNGAISWDLKIKGKYVPQGQYSWFLKWKNCQHQSLDDHPGWHKEVEKCIERKKGVRVLLKYLQWSACTKYVLEDQWRRTNDKVIVIY